MMARLLATGLCSVADVYNLDSQVAERGQPGSDSSIALTMSAFARVPASCFKELGAQAVDFAGHVRPPRRCTCCLHGQALLGPFHSSWT